MRSWSEWTYRELSLAHRWLKSYVSFVAAVPLATMTPKRGDEMQVSHGRASERRLINCPLRYRLSWKCLCHGSKVLACIVTTFRLSNHRIAATAPAPPPLRMRIKHDALSIVIALPWGHMLVDQ
jgi:hypothetical protein